MKLLHRIFSAVSAASTAVKSLRIRRQAVGRTKSSAAPAAVNSANKAAASRAAPAEKPAAAAGSKTRPLESLGTDWEPTLARGKELLVEIDRPAYPVDALGPLAPVVELVSQEAQIDAAIVGPAFLSVASLLTVIHWKVESLTTDKPLTLYFLTLALSGDGKTRAESIAAAPIKVWEEKGLGRMLVSDATMQAVTWILSKPNLPRVGYLTSEGGTFFGGHSMKGENRTATAATLNKLWDNAELSITRVTSGQDVHEYGKYLTVSLAAQPAVCADFVQDKSMADIGLVPRLLLSVAAPSRAKKYREHSLDDAPAMLAYRKRADQLLALPDGEQARTLRLLPDAKADLVTAYNDFEVLAKEGALQDIRSSAVRAAEQIARVAGVLAAWAGNDAVTAEEIRCARRLVEYSLDRWKESMAGTPSRDALKLLEYMAEKDGFMEAALNRGPEPRKAKPRRAALGLLLELGLIEQVDGGFRMVPQP